MALLRKGSSRISEQNFNMRLQREHAKTGAVTASLAWNDESDLDLHATVVLAAGGKKVINYRNKKDAGGYLDVDMHARDTEIVEEPVENIFWKKPPAGVYSISANLYKKRGARDGPVRFRALLKRDDEEDKSVEGELDSAGKYVELFRFTASDDGDIEIGRVGTPMPAETRAPPAAIRATLSMKHMKAMKVRKAAAKPKAKTKAKAKARPMKVMKVSQIAMGKKAYVQIWQGKKTKTKKGLKKDGLVKSKGNKIVSARRSEVGKKSKWSRATAKARAVKGYTGFKAIKKGTSFYEKAKELLAEM